MSDNINYLLKQLKQQSLDETVWCSSVNDYVLQLFLDTKEEKLFVVGSSGTISVLSTKNGSVTAQIKLPVDMVFAAEFDKQKTLLVLGTDQGVMQVNEELSSTFIIQKNAWFEHVKLNETGKLLFASSGKTLFVFNSVKNAFVPFTSDSSFTSTISAIAYNDGSFLVSNYGGIREYSEATVNEYNFFPWKTSLLKLAWSPNKKYIASGTQESAVHFWPYPFVAKQDFQISGFHAKVNHLCWAKNGDKLALNANEDLSVWDFSDGPPIGKTPINLQCSMGKITAMYYKNELLITATKQGVILLFEPEKSTKISSILSVENSVSNLCVSANESVLYIATENGGVMAFDIQDLLNE